MSYLPDHDQVGNRAFGERLTQLIEPRSHGAAAVIVLLAPSPPLVFMGEEFGATTPLFFCDLGDELSAAVREGRRKEFARFAIPGHRRPLRRSRIRARQGRSSVPSWTGAASSSHRMRNGWPSIAACWRCAIAMSFPFSRNARPRAVVLEVR